MSSSHFSAVAYYEAKGPYAVDRIRARDIYDASLSIIGQHLGPIAVTRFKGISIQLLDDTPDPYNRINVDKLNQPSNAPFTSILTQRLTVHKDGSRTAGGATVLRRLSSLVVDYSHIAVTVLPKAEDPDNLKTIETLVHEYGHGYGGLRHCLELGCIMESGETAPIANEAIQKGTNPFCGNCTIDLTATHYRVESDDFLASLQ